MTVTALCDRRATAGETVLLARWPVASLKYAAHRPAHLLGHGSAVAAGISPSAAARSSSLWALEDPVLANGCELRARGGDG
jgi:hypothetical protein